MKKLLIAAAAMTVVAGAQAQSSVEVFGILDIGYGIQKDENQNGTLNRKTTGLKDGALYGNRLGFRGTEDLGGGTSAKFWLEAGISPSTGSLLNERDAASGHVAASRTQQTTRQAWAGLADQKLGEVRIGWQNTLTYDLTSQRHALSIYPETRGGEGHNHVSVATRAAGATYFSPLINNVELAVQWAKATDENATNVATYGGDVGYEANVLGLGATYKAGALKAGVAYWKLKQTGTSPTPGASTSPMGYSTVTLSTFTTERDSHGTMLAASYDFGAFTVAGNYGKGESQASTTGAVSDKKQYEIGVKVPVGKFDLIASYAKAETENAAGAKTADIKHKGVGAIYNLSKRTQAYALYGTTSDSVPAATALSDTIGTRIGIAHKF
jgi:predicted porin